MRYREHPAGAGRGYLPRGDVDVIREKHDSFPLLADEHGRMLGGQFGWPLGEFFDRIRFPPVKLYERGKLVQPLVDILARNSRTPDLTVADTLALAAATRAAELRVIGQCDRFGVETYRRVCQQLLDRTHQAAALMIRQFKMVTGIVLIMALDPQILFNHGYNDLFEIRFPEGSVIQPKLLAALSNRSHTLARIFDVLAGALAQPNPEIAPGAACGSSPHFLSSGVDCDGEFYFFYEINYGGIPGRLASDGMDVHAWWPHVTSIPIEYAESYFPLRIERLAGRIDSGGAGKHRGGNGVEKVYTFLESGEVSIHDDRAVSRPWGIGGGQAAEGSRKVLLRREGSEEELPSKLDFLRVEPGDRLLYVTAGGGGWGDPLERDPEAVRLDVLRGFSREKARDAYGVSRDVDLTVDVEETGRLRETLRAGRPSPLPVFDFGR